MAEENTTGSNAVWAIALVIIVAIIAGLVYYKWNIKNRFAKERDRHQRNHSQCTGLISTTCPRGLAERLVPVLQSRGGVVFSKIGREFFCI